MRGPFLRLPIVTIWGPPNLWKVTISSCRLKVSKVGYKAGASRIVYASSLL